MIDTIAKDDFVKELRQQRLKVDFAFGNNEELLVEVPVFEGEPKFFLKYRFNPQGNVRENLYAVNFGVQMKSQVGKDGVVVDAFEQYKTMMTVYTYYYKQLQDLSDKFGFVETLMQN